MDRSTADATSDVRSLATTLVPLLREACDGRLGEVSWFKADWQRGGAATGTSTFTTDDGDEQPVILKLPIVQRELRWTQRLQPSNGSLSANIPEDLCVPRLFAGGESLGHHDLAWVIIERFEHGPLGLHWHDDHIARIAESVASFHAATSAFPIDREPKREDWPTLVKQARKSVMSNHVPQEKRWNNALKKLAHQLDDLVEAWRARPIEQWVHGDVHLANAMSRAGAEAGPVSLIDLAEVHPGHWVEDAIYLERQFWATPERIRKQKPLKLIANARKERGLPVEPAHPRLAMIRRALLAATAPCFLKSEGHPKYLEACLNRLESSLHELR